MAIELDEHLAGHLRGRFPDRLEVIQADVLETDLNQWGPAVVAGNLPYYISTAILSRALAPGSLLTRGVFLVQKEVAERVTARPIHGIIVSAALAVLFTWAGLTVAYYVPYPVGFFITTIAFGSYVVARLLTYLAARRTARPRGWREAQVRHSP